MLDTGRNTIFIWVGMNCTKNLKKSAMSVALVCFRFLLNFILRRKRKILNAILKSMNRNLACVYRLCIMMIS